MPDAPSAAMLPAALPPARPEWRNVAALARKELRDAMRNRWFLLYTAGFAVLALGLSYFSLSGAGMYGFAGFGRTAASLINLILLIVPLMALTVGCATLAGERERGTLAYLLAQPVTRGEVLFGKFIGLATALLGSLALGFGLSGAVIAWQAGSVGLGAYLWLFALTVLLALVMLSIGLLISVLTRRASVAGGIAVFVWLALVFLGDLGLLGSTVVFRLQVADLFHLALINPLQVFKLAALRGVNASLDVLGPAGLYAVRTYGDTLPALFGGVLAAWLVLPLAVALWLLRRQSAV